MIGDFVLNYGRAIAEARIEGPVDAVAMIETKYLRRWPNSKYAGALKERLAEQEKEAEAVRREEEKIAAAEAKKREAEERKEAAAELAQCSARCEHKCMHWNYADKALCQRGCRNYECEGNYCIGACQVDCATNAKAGQPGCVAACRAGRCGE